MIFFYKIFLPILKFFFIPRSPRTTRNYRSSPHNGPIEKNCSLKSYNLCITNKEITLIPKSESKKFSILCTFKGQQRETVFLSFRLSLTGVGYNKTTVRKKDFSQNQQRQGNFSCSFRSSAYSRIKQNKLFKV